MNARELKILFIIFLIAVIAVIILISIAASNTPEEINGYKNPNSMGYMTTIHENYKLTIEIKEQLNRIHRFRQNRRVSNN